MSQPKTVSRNMANTKSNSDGQLLYIAGTSFCGSTLLSFVLNTHPQIICMGEEVGPREDQPNLAYFDDFPCSCGLKLVECPLWKEIIERMRQRGFNMHPVRRELAFKIGKNRFSQQLLCHSLRNNVLDNIRDKIVSNIPMWGRRLATIADRNAAFVHVVLELTGKRVFAVAAKDPIRARYLNRIPDLKLKVVHLVRDSQGFVSSMMKNRNQSLEYSIRLWNRNASHMERLFRILRPDQFMRLRYEDFCSDVKGSMARLAMFVGLEPMKELTKFRETEHHIVGNRMLWRDSSEIVLDEVWRTRLNSDQIQKIERGTKHYRKLYGYE